MDLLSSSKVTTLKDFLVNEQGDHFCVPIVHGLRGIDALNAAGIPNVRAQAHASGFEFEVLCITFRDAEGRNRLGEALVAVYGDVMRDKLKGSYCISDIAVLPLVLPELVDVFIHDFNEAFSDAKTRKLDSLAFAEYERVLKFLARITGYAVHFHAEGGGLRPPWPDEPNVIRIATNSCPPGQHILRYAYAVYGQTIHEKGQDVLANGPTHGRGTIVKDENGESVVQLLGNTWYLLFPTISHFNTRTSSKIFARAICDAYKAHVAGPKASEPVTEEKFISSFTAWMDTVPKIFEEAVKKSDERIAQLQKDLANAIRDRTEQAAYVTLTSNSAFLRKAKKRAKLDWAGLGKTEHIVGAVFVDDGINFTTEPVEIAHDGHVYALGSFVVRISSRGQASVWHEAPTHHEGLAHPHIGRDGHPCLGNAGTAITQALGELRFADAVRYMIRWLREGYTPLLADKKLEQWPRVGETPEEYRRRVAKPMHKSEADKAALEMLEKELEAAGKPMSNQLKELMTEAIAEMDVSTEPVSEEGTQEPADATA